MSSALLVSILARLRAAAPAVAAKGLLASRVLHALMRLHCRDDALLAALAAAALARRGQRPQKQPAGRARALPRDRWRAAPVAQWSPQEATVAAVALAALGCGAQLPLLEAMIDVATPAPGDGRRPSPAAAAAHARAAAVLGMRGKARWARLLRTACRGDVRQWRDDSLAQLQQVVMYLKVRVFVVSKQGRGSLALLLRGRRGGCGKAKQLWIACLNQT